VTKPVEPQQPAAGPSVGEQHTSMRRTLAWVAGGAAVVTLAAAVVFNLGASGDISDFNASCGLMNGKVLATGTRTDCQNLYDTWGSEKRWAIAGYAAGGALLATSAILFLTTQSESRVGDSRVAMTCQPGLGGITCHGSF
jgi:peptidoglycan/LPS O-acetylase OafA/YrhL